MDINVGPMLRSAAGLYELMYELDMDREMADRLYAVSTKIRNMVANQGMVSMTDVTELSDITSWYAANIYKQIDNGVASGIYDVNEVASLINQSPFHNGRGDYIQ